MNGAPMVPVGELMVSRGGSVNPLNFPDEDFDLYSIPAFDAGKPEVAVGADIGSTKQVVQPNDVLLSKIVPHIRRAWVVGEDRGRRLIGSGEWIVFRNERVWPEYLRHVLVGDPFHQQFMQTVSGVGGSLLRARPAFVARISIPLPRLEEQRRIAAILDQAETLRTQRRATLAQLDSLTQSIFLDMFGDPVTNPKGWPLSTMGDISEVQGGLQVSTARKYLPVESPYLRVANVYRGFLDLSEIKMIRATAAEIARTTLMKDDLLVVEGHGNPNEIGRAALWTGEVTDCVHQNHLIRARFNLMKVVPAFACEYVNSPGGRQHLLRAGKSTSGLNTISVSNVRATPVALPPLPLQQTFATRIQAIESLKATHRAALAQLDALFASLQQRAFAGEL